MGRARGRADDPVFDQQPAAPAPVGRLPPTTMSATRCPGPPNCQTGSCHLPSLLPAPQTLGLDEMTPADWLAREQRLLAHLAQVAHELRSPLAGLVGLARLTAQEAELGPKHRRWLDSIARCGEHLTQTVNDLIDVGLASTAEVTLRPQPLRLSALLQEMSDLVHPELHQPDVQLHTWLQGRAAGDDPVVRVDGQRLRQLLLNLLCNAARATTAGEITLGCSWQAPGRWRFEVADTGSGLSAARLAELFHQGHALEIWAHGSADRHGGLGLLISRRLSRALGGELAVVSQPGLGTTFSFEIDAPEAPAGSAPADA